jgi:cell division protein FtsI (penicillin-binding protein 3)
VGGKEIKWETQGEAISEGTAQKITDMMRTVVEDGTGYTAAVDGYDVAAKTGTGEQAENGTYLKGKYLASLIGFAPASNPEVLLYVGLNETPYISYSSAGPVFSAIMGEVLKDMGVLSSSWDE